MQEFSNIILRLFNGNIVLTVMCFALIPVIEIRGAIPLGISLGLSTLKSVVISLIGSLIGCVLMLLLLPLIFNLLNRTKIYNKFLNAISPKIKQLEDKRCNIYVALMLFVLVPLPLTGVTTACIIACMLGLNKLKSFIYIFVGNFIASIIIGATSMFLGTYSILITLFFVIAFFIIGLIYILKVVR